MRGLLYKGLTMDLQTSTVSTLDGKYVFSVSAPDSKYTVYLVYLEEGEENTPPWCIMCICFKVKYTVYFMCFEGFLCVFPI